MCDVEGIDQLVRRSPVNKRLVFYPPSPSSSSSSPSIPPSNSSSSSWPMRQCIRNCFCSPSTGKPFSQGSYQQLIGNHHHSSSSSGDRVYHHHYQSVITIRIIVTHIVLSIIIIWELFAARYFNCCGITLLKYSKFWLNFKVWMIAPLVDGKARISPYLLSRQSPKSSQILLTSHLFLPQHASPH